MVKLARSTQVGTYSTRVVNRSPRSVRVTRAMTPSWLAAGQQALDWFDRKLPSPYSTTLPPRRSIHARIVTISSSGSCAFGGMWSSASAASTWKSRLSSGSPGTIGATPESPGTKSRSNVSSE